MMNNIIYTTIEVELMNKYQFNLEDINYKQYVYIRRLKKILQQKENKRKKSSYFFMYNSCIQ